MPNSCFLLQKTETYVNDHYKLLFDICKLQIILFSIITFPETLFWSWPRQSQKSSKLVSLETTNSKNKCTDRQNCVTEGVHFYLLLSGMSILS